MKLHAPDEFWNMPDTELEVYLRAPCGPKKALGGFVAWIVPDDLLELDVRLACGIHDFEYSRGLLKSDKIDADRNFLRNLVILIVETNEMRRFSKRLGLAIVYFLAVRFCGGSAFTNR